MQGPRHMTGPFYQCQSQTSQERFIVDIGRSPFDLVPLYNPSSFANTCTTNFPFNDALTFLAIVLWR